MCVTCDASMLDGVCGIEVFKNHAYMNALTVIRYFEFVQRALLVTVIQATLVSVT
jgi:hypothetical protein